MNSVIVHYQEIALKGRNRPWFIERLVRNLRDATADVGVRSVRALMGRIELQLDPRADWDAVRDRVSRQFGIANFARAGRAPADLAAIGDAVLAGLAGHQTSSFRVTARRADKAFPLTSPEIERQLGGRIKAATNWKVNLTEPELIVHVEMLRDEAFYYVAKERGPGGLPTGVSGQVVCLVSGGIDSPVAAFRMMKRGCRVRFVHFHSYPILSRTSQEKVREIVELLTHYQLGSRLYLVAFGEVQRQIVLDAPPPLRVVLYRRLMMRIGERFARRSSAAALVTGESVGQVASQTLDNMVVIDGATTMPILRPLIGMDKDEIVGEARRIGTYPISIVPDEDCCQLFTPTHPATHARLREVEEAERALPIDEFVDRAVQEAVREDFHFPVRRAAATPA